ncbi:MAG TPA: OmpH family outer membrane protein [Chitinophagaceae bacterium]|nr:OmpH family outer membrane protein [Chitinophagaceae bacterium]
MNKNLLVLNIILLVAVAVLFFLHFSTKDGSNAATDSAKNSNAAEAAVFRIAYFDMDSIEAKFSLFKQMQLEVSKKEDSMNAILNSARMNLQNKYRKYQEQQSAMTPADIENAGHELSKLDNDIKNRELALNQSFQSFYMSKQQEVISQIKKYCLEYNKDKKYSLIIANEPGLIYYKDTAFNITSELLKGLNELYDKQKKK